MNEYPMNKYARALVAGALTMMVAGAANAHGKVRVYADVRPYYPAVVQQHYVPAPVYYNDHYNDRYDDRFVQVRPDWEARREWRREQWRRQQWRHNHWRHHGRGADRCRHPHWRH